MKIFNIREGFATNSSSSHSIVILDDNVISGGVKSLRDTIPDYSFGWDNFTLVSKESRMHYALSILKNSIEHYSRFHFSHIDSWDNLYEKNELNIKNVIKVALLEYGLHDLYDFMNSIKWSEIKDIDHQSMIGIPSLFNEMAINMSYFVDFYNFLLEENVAILGGNDNSDYGHDLKSVTIETDKLAHLNFLKDRVGSNIIARKNKDTWTFFNKNTGVKTRFSFNDNSTNEERDSAPELVDVKITDYCDIGCSYCYQGSTKKGKHASLDNIKSVIDQLSKMQVFEVAFGGGETTEHPDFVEILRYTRSKGIVPNFTTRSTKWMDLLAPNNLLIRKNAEIIEAVLIYAGAFAYSVNNSTEFKNAKQTWKQAIEFFKDYKENNANSKTFDVLLSEKKFTVQYVMGTSSLEDLEKLFIDTKNFNTHLTLLGYKNVGRGSNYEKFDYKNWFNLINKCHLYKIGIDTALAQECQQDLIKAKVESYRYHLHEGLYSMYVDCVNELTGPSSYHVDRLQKVSLSDQASIKESWEKIFPVLSNEEKLYSLQQK